MSVKLYFVRHGQSVANLSGQFHDAPEALLTGLGHSQAASAGHDLMYRLGRDRIDQVFSSPYERALQTCHIALVCAGYSDLRPIIDERVSERKFGKLVGKFFDRDVAMQNHKESELIPQGYHAKLWNYYSDFAEKYDAEPLPALEVRARSFFADIKKNYDGKTIVVFSHGGFGQMAQAIFNGFPENGDFEAIRFLKNGEVIEFKY